MAAVISSRSKLSEFFHNKSFLLSFHRLHRHRHSKSDLTVNVAHNRTDLKASYSDELREIFRYFDADRDGRISGCDLRSYLVSIGEFMPPEEAQALINDLDAAGGDNLILEYDDFVKLMEREAGEEDLKRAFAMFVAEKREKGSGRVTQEGLQGSGGFIAQEGFKGSGYLKQEGLQGSGFVAEEGLKGSGCGRQEGLQGSGFVAEEGLKGSGCGRQEGLQGSGFIEQESFKSSEVIAQESFKGSEVIAQEGSKGSKGSGFIAQEGLQGSGCVTQEGLQGSGFTAQEGLQGSGCVTQEALQFKQEGLQDLQGFGYITAERLQKIFCHLGYEISIEECKTMIVVYDRDGDGVLGFSDFQQMMASN